MKYCIVVLSCLIVIATGFPKHEDGDSLTDDQKACFNKIFDTLSPEAQLQVKECLGAVNEFDCVKNISEVEICFSSDDDSNQPFISEEEPRKF
jgi:hypothetical protein